MDTTVRCPEPRGRIGRRQAADDAGGVLSASLYRLIELSERPGLDAVQRRQVNRALYSTYWDCAGLGMRDKATTILELRPQRRSIVTHWPPVAEAAYGRAVVLGREANVLAYRDPDGVVHGDDNHRVPTGAVTTRGTCPSSVQEAPA